VSRHARGGTQGEQDGQWELGDYPAPADDDEPLTPGGYAGPGYGWERDPLAADDTGDFPAAHPGYPAAADPQVPDAGGHRGDPYRWNPDPLATGNRAGSQPGPEPATPQGWAPQPWEPPAWQPGPPEPPSPEPQSWQPRPRNAESRHAESRNAEPWGAEPWNGELPGPGHPSGPLSPLPQSDLAWREPPSEPLPRLPAGDAAYDPALSPGGDGAYNTAPPLGRGAAYDPAPPRRSSRHAARQQEPGLPGYAPRDPAAYHAGPDDYPADPAGYPADVGSGYPGYERHVENPRDRGHDLDMGPERDAGEYPAAGGWYGDVDEPRAWAEEDYGSGLLPGLDEGKGGRRRAGGPPAGASSRKRRRRGRVAILASLMVFVVIVAAGGLVGYHYYRAYINPPDFTGSGTGTVMVQIKPGDTATIVGDRLASLGVVASARAFSNAAKASPQGNALEPGYYRVHKHMKASLAFALLLKPSSRVQAKVTIPEGFRLSQIIQLLGKDTGNLKGYQQAIANPAALGLPSFANGKPEGYLFPATYDIQPKASPVSVLKAMVTQFDQEAASIGLAAAAARAQETQGAVITVASIIEAEGKRPQDYPKIAEVVYNRLNANPQIKLQLDTTVLYAMDLTHSKAAFSTTFPSPYNTYLHAGLPPGPIDSPGNAAIEAALHPAHGNLIYFLTINSKTGQTLFFTTAQQFDAAVAKYGSTGSG